MSAPFQPGLFADIADPGAAVADLADLDDDAPGTDYCATHSAEDRRAGGVTLTPAWLVERMLDLAQERETASGPFDTIVDVGAGTGRFIVAALARLPQARGIAVEINPVLARLLRQRLRERGLSGRVDVIEGDFRAATLPLRGRALFIGNPPYVRHHDIEPVWKGWYRDGMAARGIEASALAGLHAHFLLRAAQAMRPGDALCFVTAAEWLDNGYGSALRRLLSGPGTGTDLPEIQLRSLWLASAADPVFPDALVSAVVFEADCAGAERPVQFGALAGRQWQPVRQVPAHELRSAPRWSPLSQPGPLAGAAGEGPEIELGELFRITRGQVTGMNEAWVLPADFGPLPPELALPTVTRAREIIDGTVVAPDARQRLRQVVNLPRELDSLSPPHRATAQRLIDRAQALGADRGYIARHRSPWFAVDLRPPPAAFVTYMGRRPPVFRPNPQQVSFLNIAHGLYPREPIAPERVQAILDHLNTHTALYSGRVYGGGLAKFEPSDIARLRFPARLLEPLT